MKNILGSPVRQDDFLERKTEIARLWWLVARGSVLMLAPRRVGKTSLLFHLYDYPQDGWRCLFCSVESAATEAEFVGRLLAKILDLEPRGAGWTKLAQTLRKLVAGLETIKAGPIEVTQLIERRWQDIGEITLRSMAQLKGKNLLLLDEFPIFIGHILQQPDGMNRARLFMNWFREVRNDLALRDSSVRFILTGSIGLDAVVKQAEMTSTINDLMPFSLGPLSPQLADELLRRLAAGEGVELSEDLRSRILDRISWLIPFYVQLYFGQLAQQVLFYQRDLSPALVDEVYEELLSSEKRPHFEHWVERLNHPLIIPEERDLVRAILEAAARDPRGINKDTVLQLRSSIASHLAEDVILLGLERDGYLVQQDGRWRFASPLLRDWWSRWIINKSN